MKNVPTIGCLALGRPTRKSVRGRLPCETCRCAQIAVTGTASDRGDASLLAPNRRFARAWPLCLLPSAKVAVVAAAIMLAAFSSAEAEPEALKAAPSAERPSDAGPQIRFDPFQDNAFIDARKSGSPVVLYFEADWCAPCKEMHARTFRAPQVLANAAGIRFFRVDMTNPNGYLAVVQKSFQVLGEPTIIVFGTDGKERSRRFGFVAPDVFAKMLSESRTPRPSGT